MTRWSWIAGALLGCSTQGPTGAAPPPPPPPTGAPPPSGAVPPSLPANFGALYEAGRIVTAYRAQDRATLLAMSTDRAKAEVATYGFATDDWRSVAIAHNRGVAVVRTQGERALVEIAPLEPADVAVVVLVWRPQGSYAFDGLARMSRAEYEAIGPVS